MPDGLESGDVVGTGVQVQPDLQHVPPPLRLHRAGTDTHLYWEGQEKTGKKVRNPTERKRESGGMAD